MLKKAFERMAFRNSGGSANAAHRLNLHNNAETTVSLTQLPQKVSGIIKPLYNGLNNNHQISYLVQCSKKQQLVTQIFHVLPVVLYDT